MTKAELKALEKVYAAEISGALNHGPRVFQSKAKIYTKLAEQGLLRWVDEITIPADRQCPFPIRISGWELTLLGNLMYCISLE